MQPTFKANEERYESSILMVDEKWPTSHYNVWVLTKNYTTHYWKHALHSFEKQNSMWLWSEQLGNAGDKEAWTLEELPKC